ncbi:type II secretion system minor pseudopilin GspK [Saccharospirillum sp. HFRX-1]|uniref:type II secretion system minor pseudopilin GspK n=1 Tax=unclassified Saccharospirillum TaxID=2633430 RepID=UPI003722CD81
MRPPERGFALIQVLLVFALLAVIVARLQYQQRVQLERAFQGQSMSQVQTCIDSAEAVAKVGLRLEAQQEAPEQLKQLMDENGNLYLPAFPLGECQMTVSRYDLQGRFNVNWLHPAAVNPDGAAEGFKRLLLELDLNEGIADELQQWFDSDSGAEFNYIDQEPSYRPSFMPMADISELHLLKAVSSDDYKVLAPYVSALRPDEPLNINVASREVLMSLAPFISREEADGLIEQRGDGFDRVDDLLNLPLFQENDDTPLYNEQLSVTSNWFDLSVEARYQTVELRQISRLYRTEGDNQVIVNLRTQAVNGLDLLPSDKEEGSTE